MAGLKARNLGFAIMVDASTDPNALQNTSEKVANWTKEKNRRFASSRGFGVAGSAWWFVVFLSCVFLFSFLCVCVCVTVVFVLLFFVYGV